MNLEKPYLRTSTRLTVKHLKKYLLKKIKTEMSVEVEILCDDTLLDDEHTLGVILARALARPGRRPRARVPHPLEGSFEAAAAALLVARERRGTRRSAAQSSSA